LLAMLKYLNGLWITCERLFSFAGIALPPVNIGWAVPLGISFYTLQLIGYLTDVYWNINPAQKNPAKLALFASYFPSISSGPILRYSQIEKELFDGHTASYKNITFGMQRILWGLFKKIIIAERMAAVAKPIFADFNAYNGFYIWIGLLAAVIRLYTDFSGNMDIMLGVSECFGIHLPENFTQPFFSLTFQEFWQRWHITLGGWLKDYILYPILRSKIWIKFGRYIKKRFGKKAAKLAPTFSAVLIMWLINGVWHGGYGNFIVMAVWFWCALTAGQLFEPAGDKIVRLLKINTDCFSWRIFRRTRTFAVYSIGVLFFCSPNAAAAFNMGKQAFFANNIFDLLSSKTFVSNDLLELCGGKIGLHVLLLSAAILFGVESYQNRGGNIREWLANQNIVFRWIILFGLIFAILLFGVYGPGYDAAEFIYAGL